MPKSSFHGKIWSFELLRRLHAAQPINRVLDVGVGRGTYSTFRQPGQHWIGVEAWEPYVEMFGLRALYDELVIADVRNVDLGKLAPLDLAICGDVLEHMSKEDAVSLAKRLVGICRLVLISIPNVPSEQGAVLDNPYEAHVKDDWTFDEGTKSWPSITCAYTEGDIAIFILSMDAKTRELVDSISNSVATGPESNKMVMALAKIGKGRL